MRVLQVQGLVAGGGAEIHTLILSRGLIGRGHQVFLAAPPNDEPLMNEYEEAGCEIVWMPSGPSWRSLFDWRAGAALARFVEEHEIDVIHSHLWNADVAAWIAGRLSGRPVVATLHGPTMPIHLPRRWYHRVHHWIYARFLARMDSIIAISQFMKEFTVEDLRIDADAIQVIHNCSDVDRYQAPVDVAGVRASLGLGVDAPTAILVGELTGRKGTLEFIQAAAVAVEKVPDAHFLLAGRGDLEGAARRLAEDLGVADSVHFLGWRADIPELLRASDLLAVTSLLEGFGRTITEAMSSSLPVVSFDSGAPAEIIVHGKTGILVANRDAVAFGEAMAEVLADPGKRRTMGDAGLEAARARFDTPVFVSATEEVLRRVVNDRFSRGR